MLMQGIVTSLRQHEHWINVASDLGANPTGTISFGLSVP